MFVDGFVAHVDFVALDVAVACIAEVDVFLFEFVFYFQSGLHIPEKQNQEVKLLILNVFDCNLHVELKLKQN